MDLVYRFIIRQGGLKMRDCNQGRFAHTVIDDRGQQVAVEIFKLAGVALLRDDRLKRFQCLLRPFEADRPRFYVVTDGRLPKVGHAVLMQLRNGIDTASKHNGMPA
jgi:hypothetical protein